MKPVLKSPLHRNGSHIWQLCHAPLLVDPSRRTFLGLVTGEHSADSFRSESTKVAAAGCTAPCSCCQCIAHDFSSFVACANDIDHPASWECSAPQMSGESCVRRCESDLLHGCAAPQCLCCRASRQMQRWRVRLVARCIVWQVLLVELCLSCCCMRVRSMVSMILNLRSSLHGRLQATRMRWNGVWQRLLPRQCTQ